MIEMHNVGKVFRTDVVETHALRNCLREELPPDAGDYALPEGLAHLDRAAYARAAARMRLERRVNKSDGQTKPPAECRHGR